MSLRPHIHTGIRSVGSGGSGYVCVRARRSDAMRKLKRKLKISQTEAVPTEISLKLEEALWLIAARRCKRCDHLTAFHNGHCCTFCMVPDCRCGEGPNE